MWAPTLGRMAEPPPADGLHRSDRGAPPSRAAKLRTETMPHPPKIPPEAELRPQGRRDGVAASRARARGDGRPVPARDRASPGDRVPGGRDPTGERDRGDALREPAGRGDPGVLPRRVARRPDRVGAPVP